MTETVSMYVNIKVELLAMMYSMDVNNSTLTFMAAVLWLKMTITPWNQSMWKTTLQHPKDQDYVCPNECCYCMTTAMWHNNKISNREGDEECTVYAQRLHSLKDKYALWLVWMCRFIKCAHRSTVTRSPVTWKKQGRSWELMALKKVLYSLALLSQRTAPTSQTLVVLHCIWLSVLMKEPRVIPLHQGIKKTKLRARTTVLCRNSIRDINKQEDCVPHAKNYRRVQPKSHLYKQVALSPGTQFSCSTCLPRWC